MEQAPDPARETSLVRAFAWVFAVVAVFLLAAGVRQLVFTVSGPQATATVEHCEVYQSAGNLDTHCTGSWTAGGRAAGGTIVGVGYGDIGKTVGVSVHGGTAYSHRLLSPLVLLVLSVALAVVAAFSFRARRTVS